MLNIRCQFNRALILVALFVSGCGGERPMNLVLVSFDTTRADAIACYGNQLVRTPNLDALAADGVRFTQAFTPVPITAPSHATIMTGKYPLGHGVRDNGLFTLGDRNRTLAEILGEAGWATAAAIGSYPLIAKFGLDQGFALFDDHVTSHVENIFGQRALPKSRLFFDERRAARVNEALLPWLDDHHREAFFMWLHYFDPHQPFEPPPPYDQLYADDLYFGEIAYADEAFGNLIRALREQGVYENTVVVFVADHGEGRGEHNELTHSVQTYQSTLHVPLIIRTPGGRRGGVVETRVSITDVLPTVLDLLGVEMPEDVHGRSLAAQVRSQPVQPLEQEVLYAESLSPRLAHNWGELRVLYDGDYKYIYGPRPELYDLATDPHELIDLVAERAEVAERLKSDLARFIDLHAEVDAEEVIAMDEETQQRLMALGYIHRSGVAVEKVEEGLQVGGTPPQDRVSDTSTFSQVKQLLFSGRALAARELAATLVERDPTNPIYHELLVGADLQLGKLDRVYSSLETIRELEGGEGGPAMAGLLVSVASQLMRRGEYEKAVDAVRSSMALQPSASGLYLEANALKALGRFDEEIMALEAVLELDQAYVPARVDLAVRRASEGALEEAEDHFRQAIRDEPYFPRAHQNYGAFLVASGRNDLAIDRFRRAVELEPRYFQARYALVVLCVNQGAFEEARQHYSVLVAQAPRSMQAQMAAGIMERIN